MDYHPIIIFLQLLLIIVLVYVIVIIIDYIRYKIRACKADDAVRENIRRKFQRFK